MEVLIEKQAEIARKITITVKSDVFDKAVRQPDVTVALVALILIWRKHPRFLSDLLVSCFILPSNG